MGARGWVAGSDVLAQRSAHDDYETVLAQEREMRERYEASVKRGEELAAQISQLDTDIAQAGERLSSAETYLADTEVELGRVEAELTAKQAELERERQRLRDESIAAYMRAGKPNPDLGMAMRDPKGLDDFARSRIYADVVMTDRKVVIARVAEMEAATEVLHAEAGRTRDEAAAARDSVAAEKAGLEASREERNAAQVAAQAAAAQQEELAHQLEERREQAEQRYADSILTSDTIGVMLESRQRGQKPPESTYGIFLNPIKNGRIVSPYGERIDPFTHTPKVHAGLDIDAVMGEPVRASEAGTVVIASEQGGYGLAVVIDHGNTLATLCGHMSAFNVKVGDKVERGDVVGLAGSTGWSTGPHCHWEVRVMGKRVEGTPYLDMTREP